MPEKKKLTTPTTLDKPVLRLSRANSAGKARTSSKANIKVNAKTDKKACPKQKAWLEIRSKISVMLKSHFHQPTEPQHYL